MINKEEWIEDWKINDDCYQTSKSLVEIFESFLSYLENKKKLAKRTINSDRVGPIWILMNSVSDRSGRTDLDSYE